MPVIYGNERDKLHYYSRINDHRQDYEVEGALSAFTLRLLSMPLSRPLNPMCR